MAEDSDVEKTEPPSGRRLEQAREEGQVPRSREVSAFLVLLAAAGVFWSLGPWMMQRMAFILRSGLVFTPAELMDPTFATTRFTELVIYALLTCLPLVTILIGAVFAAPFLMGSWNFSLSVLKIDLARFDPIKGLGRIVSKNGLIELVKSIGKVVLVGGVAVMILWSERGEIFAIFGQTIEQGLANTGHLLAYSFMMIVISMLLIVAIDVPYQLWSHYDKLKMSKDEVKQEYKQMEGSPEVKGKIRQLQREAARRRMMESVPTADVVVTNPTHFAVALAYKSGMRAPKVLAKGMGNIALKIREIGADNGVPLLEAPPLARALYRYAEIDEEIPAGLYSAVAEVLAYVYQLASWRQTGGQYPVPPRHIEVPPELVPELVDG